VSYEQRVPESPADPSDTNEKLSWRPDEALIADSGAFAGDERYVAVDRIDAFVVTLAVAPWPTVEADTGRLDFGPAADRGTVTVSLKRLQARVDLDRAATGQLVRAIRAGDVFRVRGFAATPGRWEQVVDVTRAARLAAKAALFSTAAPAPRADELREYDLDRGLAADAGAGAGLAPDEDEPDEAEPTPPGPVAYPAV
jgi:hypothetical protein